MECGGKSETRLVVKWLEVVSTCAADQETKPICAYVCVKAQAAARWGNSLT